MNGLTRLKLKMRCASAHLGKEDMKVIVPGVVAAYATTFAIATWGTPGAYLLTMVAFMATIVFLGEIGRLADGRRHQ